MGRLQPSSSRWRGFSFDTPPAIGYTAKPQTRLITMNLNTLRDQVHGLAKDKGWHDDTMSVIDYMAKATANLHGETSELWEAARRGELNKQCDKACPLTCIEEELADIIIRALDTAGRMGVDIEPQSQPSISTMLRARIGMEGNWRDYTRKSPGITAQVLPARSRQMRWPSSPS